MAKHTPGKLHTRARLAVSGSMLCSDAGIIGAEVHGISAGMDKESSAANADRLALCWNSHDALLAACKALPLSKFGIDMSSSDASDFVDNAGAFFEAMQLARAAIKLASGEEG